MLLTISVIVTIGRITPQEHLLGMKYIYIYILRVNFIELLAWEITKQFGIFLFLKSLENTSTYTSMRYTAGNKRSSTRRADIKKTLRVV